MGKSLNNIAFKWFSAVTLSVVVAGPLLAANKTLTIKGSNTDSGDTIQIPDTAQVSVQVADQGITITMPDLDLRLRCLGEVTADGYCYVAAGGTGGSGSENPDDLDFDRVPDVWDQCPNTPAGAAYTDKRGCADVDGDGYFTPEDECPTEGTPPVDSVGCPITTVSYTVTASASSGGSISPSGARSVEEGGTLAFTVTANTGYSFATIGGTCPGGVLAGSSYRTGVINADCSVVANFTANTTAGYCSGTPAGVVCDPSADGRVNPGGNMDSWGDKTWGFENTPIPNGKIVSFPFLANAGPTNGEGIMMFSNNMPDLTATDYHWKGWFSETPGGATLNNGDNFCQRYSPNPNPQEMRWSQASSPNRYACDLGQAERVLYFNMEVGCYEEVLADTPQSQRNCTVGTPFPGIGGYRYYYVKAYPR
jgi:hypothetical protein